MILPALTEATSPFFRPIKYSLFPPLGPGDAGRLPRPTTTRSSSYDEHVEPLRLDDDARPGRHPGLHHLGLARLRDRRPLPRARRATSRSAACTSPRCRTRRRAHADTIFLGPGEDTWPPFLARLPRAARPRRATSRRDAHARAALPPIRRDLIKRHLYLVPELDRRLARLPARLRLLLQGRVLRGRPVVLHADAWTPRSPRSTGCRAGISTSSTTTCSATGASPRRSSTACAAWAGSGRRPARSTRSSRADLLEQAVGGRAAQPVRRLRDAQRRRTCAEQRKYQNLGRDYAAAIRRLHDLGVMVNGSFVFGMDDDDPDVFDRTVEWAIEQGIETATFHILTPYPGTALYERMRGRGPHHRPTTGTSTTRATSSSSPRG